MTVWTKLVETAAWGAIIAACVSIGFAGVNFGGKFVERNPTVGWYYTCLFVVLIATAIGFTWLEAKRRHAELRQA